MSYPWLPAPRSRNTHVVSPPISAKLTDDMGKEESMLLGPREHTLVVPRVAACVPLPTAFLARTLEPSRSRVITPRNKSSPCKKTPESVMCKDSREMGGVVSVIVHIGQLATSTRTAATEHTQRTTCLPTAQCLGSIPTTNSLIARLHPFCFSSALHSLARHPKDSRDTNMDWYCHLCTIHTNLSIIFHCLSRNLRPHSFVRPWLSLTTAD